MYAQSASNAHFGWESIKELWPNATFHLYILCINTGIYVYNSYLKLMIAYDNEVAAR